METAAAATPPAKKRRTEAHECRASEATLTLAPHEPLLATDAHSGLTNRSERTRSHSQEPQRGEGGEEEDGVDRISLLPDAILGEIISLLPTKDAARTQTLASRWSGIWLSSPLNLDCGGGGLHGAEEEEADLISSILATHKGPVRRLSVPARHLRHHPAKVDAWLRKPALDNLQELEFFRECDFFHFALQMVLLPVSALRCWTTLRVVTISECRISESSVGVLRFPQLRQLRLVKVDFSKGLLSSMISGSPVLESLLLFRFLGLDCIRINSPSLVSVCLYSFSGNLIIEDAPSLERLLQFGTSSHTDVSVISAPKLETLGCLRRGAANTNLAPQYLRS